MTAQKKLDSIARFLSRTMNKCKECTKGDGISPCDSHYVLFKMLMFIDLGREDDGTSWWK